MKKLVGLGLLVLTILFTLVISYSPASFAADLIDRDALTEHDFDEINFKEASGNIISYSQYRNNIINTNQVISFNTAEELYQFSIDASFSNYNISQEEKEVLMSRSYTLGQDIDYGIMKSRRFIPIGYDFTKQSTLTSHTLKFNGVFDGRGFEISNLYLAGYESLVYEDIIVDLEIDISLSFYHAMFNYNEGTIKNFGLINPTIDLDYEHPDINNFANLVGENSGLIENVYVNESRTIQNGGMRILATRTSGQGRKTAAGIVHTNLSNATFQNAYYTGRAVVNASYIHAVGTGALIYSNNGTIESLVYDNTLYLTEIELANIIVDVGEPNYGVGESTEVLYNNSSILNGDIWHYYPADRYPALWGLNYVSGYYEINDAKDFIYFNKLQRLNTVKNADAFRVSNYILTADINFNDIAPNSYKPSSVEFGGLFEGNNKQIINFSLNQGTILGSNYYMGLFAIVTGTIQNLILSNSKIMPEDYNNLYGQHFYVGNLVGRLENGLIHNVYVDGNIQIGNDSIGSFSVGGIVGEASGQVIKAYHEGVIDLGSHDYETHQTINNKLNVGGIVGNSGTQKLILYNTLNKANINSFSATALKTSNTNLPRLNIGGVIGFVENGLSRNHNLGLLTNEGIITINEITSSNKTTIHLGGVIGLSTGIAYEYNEFQGLFENKGDFVFNNNNSVIKAAGVLVSNHTVESTFTQIFNTNNILVDRSDITAATLIYNVGNSNLNINHAQSNGFYSFNLNNKDLSMAVYTESTIVLNLRYIEIKTVLNIEATNNTERRYVKVTSNGNTNFYNVISKGNFEVNATSSNVIWISGITNILNNGYVMKNSINYSTITLDFNSTGNIYVAGLVNRNISGDLHLKDDTSRPKASKGIMNSVNNGNIDVLNSSNGNIFVGGISTMTGGIQGGSVQDSVNIGDIVARNINPNGGATFTGEGGLVNNYNSGVNVGGISAIITNGLARIYDITNDGELIAISRYFSRSGGIVGTALADEFNSSTGKINSNFYSSVTNSTNPQHLKNSIISNAINYGSVSSVTENIVGYSTSLSSEGPANRLFTSLFPYIGSSSLDGINLEMISRASSGERIGVQSSSGGIIAYGLVTLFRTINHGTVSSTDAAGGIMGATRFYVDRDYYHPGYLKNIGITVVNINTAINYGDVRSININQFSIINTNKGVSSSNFRPYNDNFITPTTSEDFNTNRYPQGFSDYIRRHPEAKRGIGGIFGRIQRAGDQFILLEHGEEKGSFDFVVNMNPNIDLIGRLDQNRNFSFSIETYDFTGAIFYSANPNDKTQAVFAGFRFTNDILIVEGPNAEVRQTVTRERTGGLFNYTYYKNTTYTITNATSIRKYNAIYEQKGSNAKLISIGDPIEDYGTSRTLNYRVQISQNEYNSISGITNQLTTDRILILYKEGTTYSSVSPIPRISETAGVTDAEYVYDEDFIMRDENTLLTTGEPITSYIYYAENALLAERFENSRPNGMYVLSTSSGSNYGSVLPRNLNIQNFRELNNAIPLDEDYSNLNNSNYYKPIDQMLLHEYEYLYQTQYNEKSELLEEDQIFEIEETSTGLILQDPEIDYSNKTITFDIYTAMLGGQTNLNFKIINAVLPSNALITRIQNDGETPSDFFNLINNYNNGSIATSTELSPMLKPGDGVQLEGLVSIGKFRSNSEAAIGDLNFVSTYYTDYEIFINFDIGTITDPNYTHYQIDGSTSWINTNLDGIRNITDKIGLRFRDTEQNIIANSFEVGNYITLEYYDGTSYIQVDNKYYSVVSELKDTDRYFSAEIDFSDKLRDGRYRIGYKFYPSDTIQYVKIGYNKISNARILNLRAITGSYYNELGIDNIHGDIAFGYELPLGEYTFNESNTIINTGIPSYLSNKTYDIAFLDYFQTTDFFDIVSLVISEDYNSLGYKIYNLTFTLENGSEITKNLLERSIEPIYFKDGVRIPNGTTNMTREALQTIIELDLGLIDEVADVLSVTNFITDFNNTSNVTITYVDGVLRFSFNQELLPGQYLAEIKLAFEGVEINIGNLDLTKLQGSSAYLTDIRFSSIAQETSYPDIYVSNENGNIIESSYEPDVYFAGIDYAGSDEAGVENFRVDGEVSNIPLDDYVPLMVEYLPIGANIYRIEYINGVANRTSNLIANFTVDPITGNPPSEEDVVITYVVVSENLKNEVFYHITVTDVDYNVTLVFDILYQDSNGNFINVNDPNSPIKEDLIIISISNYEVSKDGIKVDIGPTPITNVNDYLEFDQINELRSRANMFYAPNISELSYRFGRNLSGFYQFKLELPNGYKYDIFNGFDIENNISNQDWINTNKLNLISDYTNPLNPSLELGYYYYINGSTKLRTSNFTIVITDADLKTDWGLTNKN